MTKALSDAFAPRIGVHRKEVSEEAMLTVPSEIARAFLDTRC